MKAQERDYSHRSLYDKLGVTEDSRVALVGKHDEEFLHGLAERLAKGASTQLRAAGLGAGLVDNKISGYTASHAATQYVIPVSRRSRR